MATGLHSVNIFPDGRACFTELMTHVNLIATMFGTNAQLSYCNDYCSRLTGWSLEEICERGWHEVSTAPWIGESRVPFSALFKGRSDVLHFESDLISRLGKRYWVRWNAIALRDNTGLIVGAGCIGEDISERRQLEQAVLESSARERKNLESELHDGLGQVLFGSALLARGLAADAKRENSAMAEDLDRLSNNIDHAIDTSRRISRGLSPLADLQGGIIEALQNLAVTPNAWSGPSLLFSLVQTAPLRLSAEALVHVYRIAQEGLSNALRHANASAIEIILNIDRTRVALEILDDGIGLPVHAKASAGMGLKLIRYRTNLLRANFRVGSGPTRGTQLVFMIEQ
jgi:PAS domain S-box-containing protein